MMSSRRKAWLWTGLALSFLGAASAEFSAFVHLMAAAMSRGPSGERAMVWVYGSVGLGVLLAILFLYCLVCLIKEAVRAYKAKHNATVVQPSEYPKGARKTS